MDADALLAELGVTARRSTAVERAVLQRAAAEAAEAAADAAAEAAAPLPEEDGEVDAEPPAVARTYPALANPPAR